MDENAKMDKTQLLQIMLIGFHQLLAHCCAWPDKHRSNVCSDWVRLINLV